MKLKKSNFRRIKEMNEDGNTPNKAKDKTHGIKEIIEAKDKEIKEKRINKGKENERPNLLTGKEMDTEAFAELIKEKDSNLNIVKRGLKHLKLNPSSVTTDKLKSVLMERIEGRYQSLLARKGEAVGILYSSPELCEKSLKSEFGNIEDLFENSNTRDIVGDTEKMKARRRREFEVAIAKADLFQHRECLLDETKSNRAQEELGEQSLEELYKKVEQPQLDYRAMVTLYDKVYRSCVRMARDQGPTDQEGSTLSRFQNLDQIHVQNGYEFISEAYVKGRNKIFGMDEEEYRKKWIQDCKRVLNDAKNAKKDRSLMDALRANYNCESDEALYKFAIKELARQASPFEREDFITEE